MISRRVCVVFALYSLYFAGAVLLLIVQKSRNGDKFKKLKSYHPFYWSLVVFIPLNACSFFLFVAYFVCDSLHYPMSIVEFYGHWYLCSMAVLSTVVSRMFLMFIVWFLSRFLFKKGLTRLVIRKKWLIWTSSFLYALVNHEPIQTDMFLYNEKELSKEKNLGVSICDIGFAFISFSVVFWKIFKIIKYHHLKKTSPDSITQLAICAIPLVFLTVLQSTRFVFLDSIANDPLFSGNYSRWFLISWLPFIHILPFSLVYIVQFV